MSVKMLPNFVSILRRAIKHGGKAHFDMLVEHNRAQTSQIKWHEESATKQAAEIKRLKAMVGRAHSANGGECFCADCQGN